MKGLHCLCEIRLHRFKNQQEQDAIPGTSKGPTTPTSIGHGDKLEMEGNVVQYETSVALVPDRLGTSTGLEVVRRYFHTLVYLTLRAYTCTHTLTHTHEPDSRSDVPNPR